MIINQRPNNRITAYLSHYIRGPKGKDATSLEMENNIEDAIIIGKTLIAYFPELELYIPGGSDEFVQLAYSEGILTLDQILEIDCKIIKRRDIFLAYTPARFSNGPVFSKGMRIEWDFARKNHMPCISFETLNLPTLSYIREIIDTIRGR